jgi:hypothetical protein
MDPQVITLEVITEVLVALVTFDLEVIVVDTDLCPHDDIQPVVVRFHHAMFHAALHQVEDIVDDHRHLVAA